MSPDSDDKLLVWQRRALERIDKYNAESKKRGRRYRDAPFAIRLAPSFIALIHRAAMERDISLAGYIQRCIAKQLAIDLDIPVKKVLSAAPYPTVYDVIASNGNYSGFGPDTGEGFGEWSWT